MVVRILSITNSAYHWSSFLTVNENYFPGRRQWIEEQILRNL